jgi:hypothetical protein
MSKHIKINEAMNMDRQATKNKGPVRPEACTLQTEERLRRQGARLSTDEWDKTQFLDTGTSESAWADNDGRYLKNVLFGSCSWLYQ